VGRHADHVPLPHRPLRVGEREDGRRPFGFAPDRGGALCYQCYEVRKQERDVLPMSPNALQLLQACQRSSFTSLAMRSTSATLHREMERLMHRYITYQLEQDVKAAAFLHQIRRSYGARQ
jgi:recombinational DNA repair protein (RecF pathway)